jgi:MarR family transcriptional regulator, organic hydroperoxide resistance regulator
MFDAGTLNGSISVPIDFLRLVWQVNHRLAIVSQRSRGAGEATERQRLLLGIIKTTGPLSPSQLASVLHLHPSTVTGLLRGLEKQQLIRIVVDRLDSRRFSIRLTSRGREAARQGESDIELAVRRTLCSVSALTRGRAVELLKQVAEGLASGP